MDSPAQTNAAMTSRQAAHIFTRASVNSLLDFPGRATSDGVPCVSRLNDHEGDTCIVGISGALSTALDENIDLLSNFENVNRRSCCFWSKPLSCEDGVHPRRSKVLAESVRVLSNLRVAKRAV